MRLFNVIIPNIAISLNIAMMIVAYLDMRNPMMGFHRGTPYVVLVAVTCICSIISAINLVASRQNHRKQEHSQEK